MSSGMIFDMKNGRRPYLIGLMLLLWGIVLALAACSSEEPLPTRAVVAPTAAAVATNPAAAEAAADIQEVALVPATFTAVPYSGPQHPDSGQPVRPTALPSATSILPTNTPLPTATPLPTGTATPYVVVIPDLPPSDELGPSKLGLHVVRNNDPEIMKFVRNSQPAVVKSVDDLGFLREVKVASPKTITVGRLSVDSQDYSGNPEEAARDFVAKHLDLYRRNPGVDYWEGWNEPDPNHENMDWYARFEAERVRLMARYGLKTAIGGFATGVPEMDEFRQFLPAVEAAKEHGGVLALHEYGAPVMTYGYGSPLPGYPAYADRGILTFRYRWYYKEILEPAGLVIPLIITEAGIDGIISNRPGPSGLGWQDFQGYWVRQGIADSGIQAFLNQLAWYDAGVRQDGYVIGFTIFTAGGFGYWEKYDINPILPELTQYVQSQR